MGDLSDAGWAFLEPFVTRIYNLSTKAPKWFAHL
jgi:hypothetical protein